MSPDRRDMQLSVGQYCLAKEKQISPQSRMRMSYDRTCLDQGPVFCKVQPKYT